MVSHQVALVKQPDLCRAQADEILANAAKGLKVDDEDLAWAKVQVKLEPGKSTVELVDKSKTPVVVSRHKPAPPPKMKTVLRKFPAFARLGKETLTFVAEQAQGKVDCLVWLGHAAPGRLSALDAIPLETWESSYISLMDVVQTIYQLSPRIVNVMSCEFGIVTSLQPRIAQSGAPGGPYQAADAPRWVANALAGVSDEGEGLILNASSTKTMLTLTKNIWFSKSALDRHLIVKGKSGGGTVTEVPTYKVDKAFD